MALGLSPPIPTKPSAAPIMSQMAPRAIDARLPASPAKPSTDKQPQAPSKPPSPLTSPQPAPSPRARDLSSNQRGHVIALKQRALPGPAVTPSGADVAPRAHTPTPAAPPTVTSPNSDVALHTPCPATRAPTEPHAPTPSIVYGPRDLSGLCSGTKNPWGSIQRRRNYSYSPRNRTTLYSGSWRSHHSRSYPPRQHHTHLHPELVHHSASHPWDPEQLWPSRDVNSHLNLCLHSHHWEPPLWSPQHHSLSADEHAPILYA